MATAKEITVYVDNLPQGVIMMWFGDPVNLPENWQVCDGTNGTPDLRDMFIAGAGKLYQLGDKGGTNAVVLNTNQMPAHNHSANTYQVVGNNAKVAKFPKVTGHADWDWENLILPSNGDQLSLTTLPKDGGDKAHENRPPFVALFYIMKIA